MLDFRPEQPAKLLCWTRWQSSQELSEWWVVWESRQYSLQFNEGSACWIIKFVKVNDRRIVLFCGHSGPDSTGILLSQCPASVTIYTTSVVCFQAVWKMNNIPTPKSASNWWSQGEMASLSDHEPRLWRLMTHESVLVFRRVICWERLLLLSMIKFLGIRQQYLPNALRSAQN